MQTNARHREEKLQIADSHRTSGIQLKKNNHLCLSVCLSVPLFIININEKTRTGIKHCITKQGPKQNHRLRTESDLSIGVEGELKCISLVLNIRPRFYCFQNMNNVLLLLLSAVYFFLQVKRPNGPTRKFWLLYDLCKCTLYTH